MGGRMSRILITGGAGFLGGSVTDVLGDDHDLLVYDNLTFDDSYMKSESFARGDILDRGKLKPLLKYADCVVWLSALVGDEACSLDVEKTVAVNQESVKWLSENFCGRIVFTSTASVYGRADGLRTELSPTNPLSVYAATKLMAESYLTEKNAIIFRLGTLMGTSDRFSRVRTDLVVNHLVMKAFLNGKISVFGGKQHRPVLHVYDAARAIKAAVESEKTGVYNIAKGNMTISEIAKVVEDAFPGLVVEKSDQMFEDSRSYSMSTLKAKEELGFDAFNGVEMTVHEFKTLLESGRIANIESPRYSNHLFLRGAQ
jgi:nucleoside-diphosphate-sugar epimerase